jgi:NAD/NADP transhydrogenase beta subunit
MNGLISKLNDGAPFTYFILLLIIVIIALFVKGLMEKGENKKTISLLTSVGWFAIAVGFLGQTFGLIMAFDSVGASGDLTPRIVAEGLKMTLLSSLFGVVSFLIARVEIIILVWMGKEK